jgi:hypothetical protein
MHGMGQVITDKRHVGARLCGCGVAHLHFGATVLNVSADLLPYLAETFAAAAREHRRSENAALGLEEAPARGGELVLGKFPLGTKP